MGRRERFGVKRKIQIVAATLLATTLVSTVSAWYYANRTRDAAHLLLESGVAGSALANRLDLLLQKHRGLVRSAPAELDRKRLELAHTAMLSLNRDLMAETTGGQFGATRNGRSWTRLAGQIGDELPNLFGAGEKVLSLASNFVQDQAVEVSEGPYAAAADRVSQLIATWRGQQVDLMNGQVDQLFTIADTAVTWVSGGSGATLLVGIVGVAITGGVLRRTRRIQRAMLALAQADLTIEVPCLNDPDEIGGMARAVEIFKHNAVKVSLQQAELVTSNIRFETALSNMSQGLCLFDASGRLDVFNKRFCDIYNLEASRMRTGLSILEIVELSREAGNHPGRTLSDLLANEWVNTSEQLLTLQELGDGRVVAVSNSPMQNGGRVATYEDVTMRRAAEAKVLFLARHDSLTGLANRFVCNERIAQEVGEVAQGRAAAVLCLDLDRFKTINDTLGHPVGDGLLKAVAERLLACVRETDLVARLGGDEFAIVQTALERPEEAKATAERVVAALEAPFLIDGHQIVIGTSIGLALLPDDGDDAATLLKNADMALYRAKSEGRGTFCFFEPAMDARLQGRRQLELDLRKALVSGEFELFYQPLVNLDAGRVIGFEALLRWRHPERGLVPPNEFIPIAEEIGLIVPLGEWIVARACADAASWPDAVKVAVNLSPAQFKSRNLVGAVRKALVTSGLAASRLELEITESVLLQETAGTLATLHELRALGARVSLDDFGTGYSSLSYLRAFPFDKLKIDQSFVRDLCRRDDAVHIVRAVRGLCTGLGMDVIAEGVETEEQLAKLRAEGCVDVQGYLFSRPQPVAEVPAMLLAVRGKAAALDLRSDPQPAAAA